MTRADGKAQLQKLARVSHQIAELDARRAELFAEQARIYDTLADGERTTDLRTARRLSAPRRPKLLPVSEEDRARAIDALRESARSQKGR